jgi:hypothetical protein
VKFSENRRVPHFSRSLREVGAGWPTLDITTRRGCPTLRDFRRVGTTNACCRVPISRDVCEKWGFARHPQQRLSEIPTYDIRAGSGLKYFYAKDDHPFHRYQLLLLRALGRDWVSKEFTSSKDEDRVA